MLQACQLTVTDVRSVSPNPRLLAVKVTPPGAGLAATHTPTALGGP